MKMSFSCVFKLPSNYCSGNLENIGPNCCKVYMNIITIHLVCGTVSSIMSGLETRSLGLNTLGST